jgi:6-pyruvoyltetrahydropterin/6-carboxytetrahydropterin synthase
MKKQYLTRKGSFDSGHRVMNEKMKCFNMHGHTYIYELVFEFNEMEEIGYAIDFKEVKRVGCQWIDDILDHGMILNPHDVTVIDCAMETKSKLWLMSLNGKGQYCNPSAENISKEVFLAMDILFAKYNNLKIHSIKLWETPNCSVECVRESISEDESANFYKARFTEIEAYELYKGRMEYDDRK